jgi:hypothetical protein
MAGKDLQRSLASAGRIAFDLGLVFASHGVALPLVLGKEAWDQLAADFAGRQFSWVEAERLKTAIPHAAEEAQRRLDQGQKPNSIWREPVGTSGRTKGEQLLENGLLAAAEAQDDRKAEFIGYLVGGLEFLETTDFGRVTEADALQMVQVARDLTYRQYLLLALVREGVNEGDRFAGRYVPDIPMVLGPLLLELDGLYRRGLVAQGADVPVDPLQLKWLGLHVTGAGVVLYDLLKLASVDASHKDELLDAIDVALSTP